MRLVRQHSKVAKKLKGSSIQRYRLTNSLTAKCLDEPSNFTTEEGFPPVDQIKAMNDATPDKDFAFVRLLMKELWPKGFGNQTLSGNPSRNSQGRRSGSSKPSKSHTVREVDGALDRKRVKFVKSRLAERIMLKGQDVTTALQVVYCYCNKWMSQIICSYNQKGAWSSKLTY
ncbi:uncharacterized protein LOC120429885 [Culex pipiens pallens]|nr:uncharacterized protein LOC120429885 [Culex pipiens pallens]